MESEKDFEGLSESGERDEETEVSLGKCGDFGEGIDVSDLWDTDLPRRLFATDRFPNGRCNVYSKADKLSFIWENMKDDPEFDIIRKSSFGKLFEIPLSRCPISCKLIHALMVRQVVTKKKYEMWTVFGGQPLRFSMVEFGRITGLDCGEFPEGFKHKKKGVVCKGDGSYWRKLIGEDKSATLADVSDMLKKSSRLPSWRKLRPALLLIVDGVLIATHQIGKPTPKYVDMLKDVDAFLKFLWGRESFLWKIEEMRPGKDVKGSRGNDKVKAFRKHVMQVSCRMQGFPLALHLLAYENVPELLARISNGMEKFTFLDKKFLGCSYNTELSLNDI